MPVLGCIADDFTGATDLANVLTRRGMATVQVNGVPGTADRGLAADALVVALKTRTVAPAEAIAQSLASLAWLRAEGCDKILFKYCSTFDSTPAGNIGPVAEALMAALGTDFTIACPALPENGRTVYCGQLFVGGRPLAETGMRNHPLTPMTDSDLVRVLQAQCEGSVGLLPFETVNAGPGAIDAAVGRLRGEGVRLAIADALTDRHLEDLGAATLGLPLITGGSGIALGLPWLLRAHGRLRFASDEQGRAPAGPGAVLAGSCSEATNRQVEVMRARRPSFRLDPLALAEGPQAEEEATAWARGKLREAPILIYSTAVPEAVAASQQKLGRERASALIEAAMGRLAQALVHDGVRRLVVAGGETSGAVVSALGVRRLAIGREIAPGVPWCISLGEPKLALALKSGNFGQPDFFERAFEVLT